ncbi:uncharacterized protein LOC131630858 [Vicia villosa]|uniref:uncharacterized protein LOC131630858 n=1 Tax=Vicia villosa TaxID=3911 RepID=UPI00273AF281|nr:uncharacterized protein LOC131630858 [Vicia villosa]
MLVVKTITCKFNVNGELTTEMQARRGVRQGDPISPLLFVVMMEYLNRLFVKMQKNSNFNHHAKCEKFGITHLTFADDVLMFCRGDVKFVDMMMMVLHTFADTIGLVVNPRKCKVFFGGVDLETRNKIKELTTYEEGLLPFRYLGVPLITRKLNIKHYLPLIDKILAKVKHWSFKLLSMKGGFMYLEPIPESRQSFGEMGAHPLPKEETYDGGCN